MGLFITCFSDWVVNIHRDTYACLIGHYSMSAYLAAAENESIGRERYSLMQVMFSSVSAFFLWWPVVNLT